MGGAEMFEHEHASGRRQLTIDPLRRNRADERRYSAAARLGNFADACQNGSSILCWSCAPTASPTAGALWRPPSDQFACPDGSWLPALPTRLERGHCPSRCRDRAAVVRSGSGPAAVPDVRCLEDAANVPLASIHVVIVFRPLARGTRDRRTAEDQRHGIPSTRHRQ